MTALILRGVSAVARRVKSRFIAKTKQIEATQSDFLFRLLHHQQSTELGQKFGLAEIKTIDQFRSQVPILPYEWYAPLTERVANGEPNVLTTDRVTYVSLTSGSTGNQKKIPVTKRFQRSLSSANIAAIGFMLDAFRERRPNDTGLHHFQFQLLTTNSATLQGKTPAGIEYGPVTVGSLRNSRLLYQFLLANPYASLAVADSASRHYVCLLFALGNPQMRGLVTNFPMLVLRTCNYLNQYAESLIDDLEHGTLATWLQLSPALRQQLERRLVAKPAIAARLRSVYQEKGCLTPKLAWPDLALITTAMGGTSDFYFNSFPNYFGDTPIFGGVYGTAEGTFGVYHDLDDEGTILAIESGFYEFVPRDQWDAEQPKTILPMEAKVGDRYRIIVTSYSGIYRYDIGDVVEVVGFYEQTPIIVFRHRRGGLLSSTTEKTTEFHVTQAMQALTTEFGLRLDDFCVTLAADAIPAAYLVNIELASGQELADPQAFIQRFDYWLAEFNNPYGTVRGDQVPSPRLRILEPGSFTVVRERQKARGMSDSQLKFPHISEDRDFLNGLTVLDEFQG